MFWRLEKMLNPKGRSGFAWWAGAALVFLMFADEARAVYYPGKLSTHYSNYYHTQRTCGYRFKVTNDNVYVRQLGCYLPEWQWRTVRLWTSSGNLLREVYIGHHHGWYMANVSPCHLTKNSEYVVSVSAGYYYFYRSSSGWGDGNIQYRTCLVRGESFGWHSFPTSDWGSYGTRGLVDFGYSVVPDTPASCTVPSDRTTAEPVTVSWPAAKNASYYELHETSNNWASWSTYTTTGLSYVFSGRNVGTYRYRVRSRNPEHSSAYRYSGYLTVRPPPPALINVPLYSPPNQAYTISWSTVILGGLTYELQESINADFSGATSFTGLTGIFRAFTKTDLEKGSYHYRVRARVGSYASHWRVGSNPCYVGDLPPPDQVIVPANSITGNYTVSWSVSLVVMTLATSYTVEESTQPGFSAITDSWFITNMGQTYVNVASKAQGVYYYRVRCDKSTPPTAVSPFREGANPCTVLPPPRPGAITVPFQSASGTYEVSWSSCVGAGSYTLREFTTSGFTPHVTVYSGADTDFVVTGKTSGTYFYEVAANNGAGSSGWTIAENGCVIVPPDPPTALEVPTTTPTGNFTVAWSASDGATGYRLEEDVSPLFQHPLEVFAGDSTAHEVEGKTSGTYFYRVRAYNRAGDGPWRTSSNGCQIIPPTRPEVLSVPSSSTSGGFLVEWSPTDGAQSYELEQDSDATFSAAVKVYAGPMTCFSVRRTLDATYYFRVRALNGAGASEWFEGANGCVVTQMVPLSPATVTVPASSITGHFEVTWASSVGASAYVVEEAADDAFTLLLRTLTAPETALTVLGKPNGAYFYRVKAVNALGASDWQEGASGCVVVLTQAALYAVATHFNPPDSREKPGALGVPMLHIELCVGLVEGAQLQNLVLQVTGSGDDANDILTVVLWADTDRDGLVGPADRTAASGVFALDNGTLDLDLSAEPVVPPGECVAYLVTCDFAGSAAHRSDFSISIDPAAGLSALGIQSAQPLSIGGAVIKGGVKTLAPTEGGSLSIHAERNAEERMAYSPSSGVRIHAFRLLASSVEDVTVQTVRFSTWGEGDEAAGVTARLFHDVDADGALSAPDLPMGLPRAFAADNAELAVTGLALQVPAGQATHLLLVYDFPGNTGAFSAALEFKADVEAVGAVTGKGIASEGSPAIGPQVLVFYVPTQGSSEDGRCAGAPDGSGNGFSWLLLAFAFLAALRRVRKGLPIPDRSDGKSLPL